MFPLSLHSERFLVLTFGGVWCGVCSCSEIAAHAAGTESRGAPSRRKGGGGVALGLGLS
jgi:hypothetical protein